MRLDIFADVICPWCYIGKRRLERALAERPRPGLSIRWRVFQLNPQMPRRGMDNLVYASAKFGSASRANEIHATIEQVGRSEGLQFAFDLIQRAPNTVDAHRLIAIGADHGVQEQLVSRLYQAHFSEAKNIGDCGVLAELAGECGLDPTAIRAMLDSNTELDSVLREDRHARRMGVNSVPCFVFNGRHLLYGAQPPEVLHQIFDLASQEAGDPAA